MNGAKLYLILDREVNAYERLFDIARQAIGAGVDMIQLRDKNGSAKEILGFSKSVLRLTRGRVPYIINDRVDLAAAGRASGVHLGQDDVPVAEARKMMGTKALIGVSCQTFAQAKKARREGADYIGFGSVFKTLTKPDRRPMDMALLARVVQDIKIPVFAVGGIRLKDVAGLKLIGADRVAVCRAVCLAEDVGEAVRRFKRIALSE